MQQQQQQQQHLIQQQGGMMPPSYYSNNVTSDHIQQYLDENKSLILKIVESQNSGRLNECAENQARLQRNLMYLAALADAQPQQPTLHSQYSQSNMMQSGSHYMPHQHQQEAQQMWPQALMMARSSMLYSQQAYSALQHSQSLHGHMGMGSASSSGLGMGQGDPHTSMLASGSGFSDYGRGGNSGFKQEIGHQGSGADSKDGEGLYLKSGDGGN